MLKILEFCKKHNLSFEVTYYQAMNQITISFTRNNFKSTGTGICIDMNGDGTDFGELSLEDYLIKTVTENLGLDI